MALRLTERDASGTVHLRPAGIPVIVAALALPVIGALLLGTLTSLGMGVGLAVGAATVLALIVGAARAKPDGPIEIAPRRDAERRVLVIAATEVTAEAAAGSPSVAGGPDDVRVVVPVGGRQIDRWTSATDNAREAAQDDLGPLRRRAGGCGPARQRCAGRRRPGRRRSRTSWPATRPTASSIVDRRRGPEHARSDRRAPGRAHGARARPARLSLRSPTSTCAASTSGWSERYSILPSRMPSTQARRLLTSMPLPAPTPRDSIIATTWRSPTGSISLTSIWNSDQASSQASNHLRNCSMPV